MRSVASASRIARKCLFSVGSRRSSGIGSLSWMLMLCASVVAVVAVSSVPIFGALSSWLYFLLVAVLCLLPNAAVEVWYKLYKPATYQTLQHIPAELVAAREEAERKAVEDAVLAKEAAAQAAKEAVAASKALAAGRRRRTRASMGGVDMTILAAIQPAGPGGNRASSSSVPAAAGAGTGAGAAATATATPFGASPSNASGAGPTALHPASNPLHPQAHVHKPLHVRIGDATPKAANE